MPAWNTEEAEAVTRDDYGRGDELVDKFKKLTSFPASQRCRRPPDPLLKAAEALLLRRAVIGGHRGV